MGYVIISSSEQLVGTGRRQIDRTRSFPADLSICGNTCILGEHKMSVEDGFIDLKEIEPSPVEEKDDDYFPPASPPPTTNAIGLSHSAVWYLSRIQKYSSYAFTGKLFPRPSHHQTLTLTSAPAFRRSPYRQHLHHPSDNTKRPPPANPTSSSPGPTTKASLPNRSS